MGLTVTTPQDCEFSSLRVFLLICAFTLIRSSHSLKAVLSLTFVSISCSDISYTCLPHYVLFQPPFSLLPLLSSTRSASYLCSVLPILSSTCPPYYLISVLPVFCFTCPPYCIISTFPVFHSACPLFYLSTCLVHWGPNRCKTLRVVLGRCQARGAMQSSNQVYTDREPCK